MEEKTLKCKECGVDFIGDELHDQYCSTCLRDLIKNTSFVSADKLDKGNNKVNDNKMTERFIKESVY